MHISWRERLTRHPSLQAFSRWPMISLETIPRARRKTFLRNQQIVAQVLRDDALQLVAKQHNLSCGRISQLLDRCLGGDEAAPPALTQGLIPYLTVVRKQRQGPLPTLHKSRGPSCAFKHLLNEVPGLQAGLDTMIRAKLNDNSSAQALNPHAFHGEFKRLLLEAHWPGDHYPYTTDSTAYESTRRYLHQRTAELQRERTQRHQPPPRELGVTRKRYRALSAIQIDEHVLDLKSSVHLQLNEELIPLRLARANVLVATDVDTSCALGYCLAPTRHPNQQDLLTLFDHCIQPWQPLTLTTPGLEYAPGANFPSGLDAAFPMSFGVVQLDNAFMHRAQSVIELLCEHYGATLSYGLPAMPKIRELVESVFNYINTHCSHRVASTSGSYPTDPKKESRKNLKNPPIMTFQTLNEALSVILTEYNITPRASLGNASPLELFQHHCATHFVRFVPPTLMQQFQPLMGSKEVALHWHTDERRLPHVNFYYCRYQGPGLIQMIGKEKRIRVQFDRRDIRTLRAFTRAGEDLGELQVSTSWQRFAHTLATRQWIHKNAKHYHLQARDPLSAYFRHLLENKGQPEMALALLRVYNEFTGDLSNPLVLGGENAPRSGSTETTLATARHTWRSEIANRRE